MNDDFLSRYDKMKRLDRPATYTYGVSRKDCFSYVAIFALGVSLGLVAAVSLQSCDRVLVQKTVLAELVRVP